MHIIQDLNVANSVNWRFLSLDLAIVVMRNLEVCIRYLSLLHVFIITYFKYCCQSKVCYLASIDKVVNSFLCSIEVSQYVR